MEQSSRKGFSSFLRHNALVIGSVMFAVAVAFSGLYVYASTKDNEGVACGADACISLYPEYAEPNIVTVKAGSYVQFNSTGKSAEHNLFLAHSALQHEDDSQYQSGDFGNDEAWKVQFKRDGAYSFADKYNDKIYINVVVYTEGKDYKVD